MTAETHVHPKDDTTCSLALAGRELNGPCTVNACNAALIRIRENKDLERAAEECSVLAAGMRRRAALADSARATAAAVRAAANVLSRVASIEQRLVLGAQYDSGEAASVSGCDALAAILQRVQCAPPDVWTVAACFDPELRTRLNSTRSVLAAAVEKLYNQQDTSTVLDERLFRIITLHRCACIVLETDSADNAESFISGSSLNTLKGRSDAKHVWDRRLRSTVCSECQRVLGAIVESSAAVDCGHASRVSRLLEVAQGMASWLGARVHDEQGRLAALGAVAEVAGYSVAAIVGAFCEAHSLHTLAAESVDMCARRGASSDGGASSQFVGETPMAQNVVSLVRSIGGDGARVGAWLSAMGSRSPKEAPSTACPLPDARTLDLVAAEAAAILSHCSASVLFDCDVAIAENLQRSTETDAPQLKDSLKALFTHYCAVEGAYAVRAVAIAAADTAPADTASAWASPCVGDAAFVIRKCIHRMLAALRGLACQSELCTDAAPLNGSTSASFASLSSPNSGSNMAVLEAAKAAAMHAIGAFEASVLGAKVRERLQSSGTAGGLNIRAAALAANDADTAARGVADIVDAVKAEIASSCDTGQSSTERLIAADILHRLHVLLDACHRAVSDAALALYGWNVRSHLVATMLDASKSGPRAVLCAAEAIAVRGVARGISEAAGIELRPSPSRELAFLAARDLDEQISTAVVQHGIDSLCISDTTTGADDAPSDFRVLLERTVAALGCDLHRTRTAIGPTAPSAG